MQSNHRSKKTLQLPTLCLSTCLDFGFAVILTISLIGFSFFSCIGHLYKEWSFAKNDLYQHCFQVCRKCHFALKRGEIHVGKTAVLQFGKQLQHFFLPRQDKQMLSAGLPRRKRSYPHLVKAAAGMPVSPFHKDILRTGVVLSNKMLSHTYIGHSIALIILYLTSW